jgi:hypothetical protein
LEAPSFAKPPPEPGWKGPEKPGLKLAREIVELLEVLLAVETLLVLTSRFLVALSFALVLLDFLFCSFELFLHVFREVKHERISLHLFCNIPTLHL